MKFFTAIIFCLTLSFRLVFAQPIEPLERIEVKSSKSEFFQLTNPAQESLSGDQLQNRSLFHGEEIWNQFANVSTASGANRVRYFKIRGIGERSEYDSIPSNSVGVFYDHIDLSGLSGILALYDVGQVEVLKGPQTFLYGDSSLGGNIILTSTDIAQTQRSIWGGVGSQNHRLVGTSVSASLSESLSVKVGLQKNDSDGYFYNSYFQEHTSKRDELFANFAWQADLGSSFLRVSHIYGENKNGNDLWNTDRSYTVYSDTKGNDDQLTHGHSLEWSGPLTQDMQYLLIGSYSHTDQLVSYDEDWNNNDFWNDVSGWNKDYDYFKSYNRRKTNLHLKSILQHQWSRWDFSYGIHYYRKVEKTDVNSFRRSILRSNLLADYQADKIAILANANYHLTEKSRLNLSTRLEQQDIKYEDSNNFNSRKNNRPFAFNLLYRYTAGAHLWQGLVARGFKGAGFNPEINLTSEQQQYDPEYAMNYELLWRYQGLRYKNSVSLFYMDRRHHQITTSSQDDPNDPSQFTLFVDNAARSHHYGLEWQGEWTPDRPFSLISSIGLMRAQFVDYQLRNRSYGGRDLAHAPSYTYALTALINLTSRLKLSLNATGRDAFYYSNSHDERSQHNTLFNSGLFYSVTQSLQLSLWGKNLFNKRYSQRGFYFGNEPPNFEARLYEQNAPPQEWGFRAKYQF